ncbi:hypothetical protein CYLTODRAFT_427715 [Cylindrobasidium torrendii FP15055 ss-10]|uniref:Uncharacterized protein n=1 Tax=Cylindrobasidium torrendii FP15055 ss-10 TaxID=1314674 RepID=A0A0D7AUL8_9AGAR|nr:hypothetical protein CYLTODRAFT_427715 [Cylindrobasidium torrendii FP15055 ss-10]
MRMRVQPGTFNQPRFRNRLALPDRQINSRLQWLLREKALDVGLPIRPDGFVPISALAKFPLLKAGKDPLTLEYFTALRDAHPHGLLELKEESYDPRFPTWLIRTRGTSSMPGISYNTRLLTLQDLPTLPFTSLFLVVPSSQWPTIRRFGVRAAVPFLRLEKDISDTYNFAEEDSSVIIVLNIETYIHTGASFYISSDGSVTTTGDKSGHLDPQGFAGAFEMVWSRETIISDGTPSLLDIVPQKRPSFTDRPDPTEKKGSTRPSSVKTGKQSHLVTRLAQRRQEALLESVVTGLGLDSTTPKSLPHRISSAPTSSKG